MTKKKERKEKKRKPAADFEEHLEGRCSLDPAWLWLWRRPVAVAPMRPLAWEPPYALGAALEKTKKDQK